VPIVAAEVVMPRMMVGACLALLPPAMESVSEGCRTGVGPRGGCVAKDRLLP
jgi:hypothetical protein